MSRTDGKERFIRRDGSIVVAEHDTGNADIGPQRATPSSAAKIAERRQCTGRLSCSSCVSEVGCLDKYANRKEPAA